MTKSSYVTSDLSHPIKQWKIGRSVSTSRKKGLVSPQVIADDIDVNIREVLTSTKSNPYYYLQLGGWQAMQSMELANDDDNDISIHCVHQACGRALSKSILKVNKHPGICFFVVT